MHAWSIYVVIGLVLAYAIHLQRRPISICWTLEPSGYDDQDVPEYREDEAPTVQ